MEREQFVPAADGTRLYTKVRGEGRPVVLCDGLGCDGFVWRYLEEPLAAQYQVVRWHYRGHGLSSVRAQWLWRRALRSELTYQAALRLEVDGARVRRSDFEPYFRHLAGMDIRVFTRLLAAASAHSTEERLAEIRQPTLVVGGERDT